MINFSVNRPVATTMFFLGVILLGIISLTRLPISLFPDIVFPKLTILTPYNGVSPEEMENLVSRPIEDAVSSVNGVFGISSRSQEGLSIVEIQLEWGLSLDLAIIQLRQKLDLAKALLPQDSGRSIIVRYDPSVMPIVTLVAKPVNIDKNLLRDIVNREVRPFLERISGVASINILGGRKREIRIDIDANRLNGFGLGLNDIRQSLEAANFAFPAGQVYKGDREYTVRFQGEFKTVDEINNIIVNVGESGQPVHLKQIAEIQDNYKDPKGTALYNGDQAVIIGIKKEPGKNTVSTALAIRESLIEINQRFDQRLQFEIIQDRSLYISEAIASVSKAAILGGCIAFLVLLLFLKDIKAALIILTSLPIAVLSTFILMYAQNISLNIMSLGGLSLGIGMLVDNSIVVLESIYQQYERNPDKSLANHSIEGTRNVSGSILASTLTSVIVFLPIIFVSGVAGAVFKDLALTVSFSLLSSLLTAMTLIPMLSSLSFSPRIEILIKVINQRLEFFFLLADNFIIYLQQNYILILEYTLQKPKLILGFTALLSLFGLITFLPLEKRLFPEVDRGEVSGKFSLKGGTDIPNAIDIHLRLHDFIKKNNLAKHSITIIGYDEDDIDSLTKGIRKPDYASADFYLDSSNHSSSDFIKNMEIATKYSGDIQASFNIRGDALQELFGNTAGNLQLDFEGRDRNVLRELAEYAYRKLRESEKNLGITELLSTAEARDPEIKLSLDRRKIASLGLSPGSVAQLLRTAVEGGVATVFRNNDQEIDVRIRLRPADRQSIQQLHGLYVPVGQNGQVKLGELLHKESSMSMPTVLRENQRRLERLSLKFSPAREDAIRNYLGMIIQELKEKQPSKTGINNDVNISINQLNSETMESLKGLLFAMGLSSILIYMLLAGQFESLLHPITLALTIPTMLWGAGGALLITGHSLNITSTIGLILLVGIVVNSAIVLYEYIEQKREAYKKDNDTHNDSIARLPDVLKEAGKDRLRPILLTTITTLCGMLPLALELGEGSEMQSPMAVAVVGGLSISSIMTLIVFPVLYFSMERMAIKFRNKFHD